MQQGIRVTARAVIVRDEAIVLSEYDDEQSGRHFNLPGGGVNEGEALSEAVQREVREETGMRVHVGRLLTVWEYVPSKHENKYGTQHTIAFVFVCEPIDDIMPRLAHTPDSNQINARWVPWQELEQIPLIPDVAQHIQALLLAEQGDDIVFRGQL